MSTGASPIIQLLFITYYLVFIFKFLMVQLINNINEIKDELHRLKTEAPIHSTYSFCSC